MRVANLRVLKKRKLALYINSKLLSLINIFNNPNTHFSCVSLCLDNGYYNSRHFQSYFQRLDYKR